MCHPSTDQPTHLPTHLHAHCIQVISMRTLALLGKRDAGAPRAFFVHVLLASLLVATPSPNPPLALTHP